MLVKTGASPLERLSGSYTHSLERAFGSRLVFSDSGKARLQHTAGWILGISQYDKEVAERLAENFCKSMDRFSQYGGEVESPEGNRDHAGDLLRFPNYKIVLGDDGTHCGFSVLWYRAVPPRERHKHHEANFDADKDFERTDGSLRLNKDLEEYRLYWPTWDAEHKGGLSYEWMHYGFCFNGGLIYHFKENDMTNGSWSTHT